jgi:hypothetical protein
MTLLGDVPAGALVFLACGCSGIRLRVVQMDLCRWWLRGHALSMVLTGEGNSAASPEKNS